MGLQKVGIVGKDMVVMNKHVVGMERKRRIFSIGRVCMIYIYC